jgi:hypothetical protein
MRVLHGETLHPQRVLCGWDDDGWLPPEHMVGAKITFWYGLAPRRSSSATAPSKPLGLTLSAGGRTLAAQGLNRRSLRWRGSVAGREQRAESREQAKQNERASDGGRDGGGEKVDGGRKLLNKNEEIQRRDHVISPRGDGEGGQGTCPCCFVVRFRLYWLPAIPQ